jgi:protein-S-isoprenylcysteine O-methyltransferase Ste14
MPEPSKPTVGALRLVAGTVVFSVLLFAAAGTAAWPAAWAYLGVITTVLAAYAVIIARLHPDLIEERRRPPADAKQWDKPLAAIVGVAGPVVLLLLCGLDRRFRWSGSTPAWAHAAGLFAVAAGGALTNWAVAANRFFSGLVRIQRDRGHRVVDAGPYRAIRHPGYAGSMLYMVGMTFALGSRVALAAAAVLCVVLAARTALEDRTLLAELEGYPAYARRVRFRLVPGVW